MSGADVEPRYEFPSLRRPREIELLEIIATTRYDDERRLRAEKELDRLWGADRHAGARVRRALELECPVTLPARSVGGGFRKVWPPAACRKHGLLPCSQCHNRKRRKPPNERYVELAREAGWDPKGLRQPFVPGRKSQAQFVADAERRGALVDVVKALRNEGFTQKAIGEAIGYMQAMVSKLLRS